MSDIKSPHIDLWRKFLTIMITIMIVMTGYMATSVRLLSQTQHEMAIQFEGMGHDVLNHNINAEKYIEQIEENTNKIIALEKIAAVALADRISRQETLKEIKKSNEDLKKFMDRYYNKK